MSKRKITRRQLLRTGAAMAAGLAASSMLAACGATPTPVVVKETVVVQKEVTKVVAGTPQVVKETVVVKEIVKETVVVEKVKEVTPAVGVLKTIRFLRRPGGSQYHTYWSKVYEGRNPDLRIKVEETPYADIFAKNLAQGATGLLEDVIFGHNIWEPYLAYKGLLLDFEPLIKTYGAKIKFDDYFPSMIADARGIGADGKLYWFPDICHTGGNAVVWYNIDLIKARGQTPPSSSNWTVAQMLELARACTDPAKQQYGIMVAGMGHPLYVQQYTRTWGKDPAKGSEDAWLLTKDGKKQQLGDQFPLVKEALEAYYKLAKDGITPTSEKAAGVEGGVGAFWNNGQVALRTDVSGASVWFDAIVKDKFKYGAVLWPKGPSGHRGSCLSYNLLACSGKTKYPEESFLLAAFMTSAEVALWYCLTEAATPLGVRSAWKDPKVWAKNPVWKEVGEWFDAGIDPFPQPWNLRFVEWQDTWTNETQLYRDGKEDWAKMVSHVQPACQKVIDLPRP